MELWHCAHKVAASPNLQRCPRLLLSQLRFHSNHIPVRSLHQSLSPLRRAHPATLHHHKRCQSTVMSAAGVPPHTQACSYSLMRVFLGTFFCTTAQGRWGRVMHAVLDGQRTAQVIDGKRIADTIRKEIAEEAAALKSKYDRSPGLAVVLVGARGDSATYVRMKRKACAETGIESFSADLPEDIDEEDLLKVLLGMPCCKGAGCKVPGNTTSRCSCMMVPIGAWLAGGGRFQCRQGCAWHPGAAAPAETHQ